MVVIWGRGAPALLWTYFWHCTLTSLLEGLRDHLGLNPVGHVKGPISISVQNQAGETQRHSPLSAGLTDRMKKPSSSAAPGYRHCATRARTLPRESWCKGTLRAQGKVPTHNHAISDA